MDEIISSLDGMWVLLGICLVFFMQAGFAMVETGFTRAKNCGNIIMKNLMDFCIGGIVFWLLGYGIMQGADFLGVFGTPVNPFAEFDWMHLMFHMVFCATSATIVSGAMAERTKFSTYCIFSLVMSMVIYPISGHWIWGGGFLADLGFVDFAGSTAVHLVGGVASIIGASLLGPRIGKYAKGKDGKLVSKAIPAHNIALGALGVFILWFGWYGFNGSSEYAITGDSLGNVSSVFVTTSIACAASTITSMMITWIKYKKPDVSMTLNGCLAGLVAVTAGCHVVSVPGALCIGLIAGFVVVFGIEFVDKKLHIDDPVGAIGVHGMCGAVGTLLVGIFSKESGIISGFIYNDALTAGEAFKFLGVQALGVVCVIAWVGVSSFALFKILDKTLGLRVSREEEISGLDICEHGLVSAYADFSPMAGAMTISAPESAVMPIEMSVPVYTETGESVEEFATPIKKTAAKDATDAIFKVDIICNDSKFELLKHNLGEIGITGITVTHVLGCGQQKGKAEYYRGVAIEPTLLPKIKAEIVVCKVPVEKVVETAKKSLYSGHIGDGKIFVYSVERVVRIRTGEENYDALQDDLINA